jgi:F0F1-type ATP synthase assembly protein I
MHPRDILINLFKADTMNRIKNIPYIDKEGNIVSHDKELEKREKTVFDYTKYMNVGFQLAFPLLGGVFLGLKLDECFKTTPIFTISLIVFGAIASLYSLIRLTQENEH